MGNVRYSDARMVRVVSMEKYSYENQDRCGQRKAYGFCGAT